MGLLLTQGLVIGGKVEPLYAYSYALAIDQSAGDANITVTNTDGSDFKVQWGDGEYTTQTNGVAATHTYSSDYDGVVVIRSESPITALSSTDGDWTFNVASLPATLQTLDFSGASVAIYGDVSELPASLTTLDLAGTSANISGDFSDETPMLVSVDLNASSSTMVVFIENFPSTLEYFDVSSSSVVVNGDLANAPESLAHFDADETNSLINAASRETGIGNGAMVIVLSDTNLGSAAVDNILIALATITTWGGTKIVDIGGNNAPRTSASDDAVTTLEGYGVTVTVNETAGTAPVPYDGETAYVNGGTSIDVDKPASTADDDVLCAVCYADEQSTTGSWSAPAGFTQIFDYTSAQGRQRHVTGFRKVASSEGSGYTFTYSGSAAQLSAGIIPIRGIDTTNVLDVAYSAGSHALDDGSEPFTSPSITTANDGSVVVAIQAISHDSCTAAGAPAGFDMKAAQIGQQDGQLLMATREMATAGTLSPGAWTSTFDDTDGSATTILLAFRAAAAGSPITSPTEATLSVSQAAGAIDLTVTTSDASPFVVDWGDGTISAEVASGAQATHTYDAAYDGDVVVHSDGNITIIESVTGGWDFALTALPSTLTALRVYGVGVTGAITGTLSQLPSGLTDLQLFNTDAAITGDLGDEPSGMVTMYLSTTNSVIGGASADMASTFVNLSLRNTDSDAAFNLANIPSSLRILRIHDSSCTLSAASHTTNPTAFELLEAHNLALTETVVDDVLQTLSTISTWTGSARIDIGGTNAERSTDSNSYVTTLEGNGVTVNANGPVDAGTGDPPPIDPPPVTRAAVIFTGNFDDGQIYVNGAGDDHWGTEYADNEPYHSRNFQILSESDPDGITPLEGTHCARFYWQRNDPKFGNNKTRSEIKKPGNLLFSDGDEFWIGYGIFIPNELAMIRNIARTHTNNSVTQFHDFNAHGTSQLMTRNNQWEWSFGALGKQFCGNIVVGKWTRFVCHMKVSSNSSGFARMWIDADSDADTPVYNKTGTTLRSGVTQLSFKAGIYTQDFDSYSPTIDYIKQYHDAFRIARGAGANFNSVKPGA